MDKISKHNLYVFIVLVEATATFNLVMLLSGFMETFGKQIGSMVVGTIAFNVLFQYIMYLIWIMPLWVNKKDIKKVAQ